MPSSTAASRRVLRVAIAWMPSSTVPIVTCVSHATLVGLALSCSQHGMPLMQRSHVACHRLQTPSTRYQLESCESIPHAAVACCMPYEQESTPCSTACLLLSTHATSCSMQQCHTPHLSRRVWQGEHKDRAHQAVHRHGLRLAQPVAAVLEAPATQISILTITSKASTIPDEYSLTIHYFSCLHCFQKQGGAPA